MRDKFTNVRLEEQVLGSMSNISLPNNAILMDAMDLLHESCFTSFERRALFQYLMQQHVNGKEISPSALTMDLLGKDVDMFQLLINLTSDKPNYENSLTPWVHELNDLRIDRGYTETLRSAWELMAKETDRPTRREHAESIQDKLIGLIDINTASANILVNTVDGMKELQKADDNNVTKIRTGLANLDEFLRGGINAASLVVIGAAPSAGKTHLGLKMLYEMHCLQPEKEAIIFTLEGTRVSINERLVSHHWGKDYKYMSKDERRSARESFSQSNISISEKQEITLDRIQNACKRVSMRKGISVVMVDYLDRIKKPKGEMRQDEKLAEIANGLANMAVSLNCIVILTTQLNKEAIKRSNRRPEPVDSKNSSGQAEAASYWFGIKRISQWDEGVKYPDSNLVELIVGKNRNDSLEGIVYFEGKNGLYNEIDQNYARELVIQSDEMRKSKPHNHPIDKKTWFELK
jgi:replicative DNA helicase